jgi:RNA polymerase-binding transcription factor DksA
MAVKKKQVAKPSKNSKLNESAKIAAPAKKKTAPAKKAATKKIEQTPAKKAAVKKNTTPEKPVVTEKKAPAKKAIPVKKSASNINQQTVNKKNIMPETKATKAATATKAVPEKKTAPAKKEVVETKKEVPAKKAAAAKVAAKPEPKPVAAPKPAPVKKEAVVKKPATKAPIKQMPAKPVVPLVKPMPTPAARPTEKKPTVIIAHRKLENKSKPSKVEENIIPPYQPEVYRSILDDHLPEPVSTTYRYSDEELNEFKQLINTRLDAARKELNYLQGLITRKDEAGTEDTENRFMNMEDGSGAMEREQLAQLASRQIQFMNHLEKALVRIENKTYGVCRVTGKLIDKARLRAVPHATLSIEAKNTMSSNK